MSSIGVKALGGWVVVLQGFKVAKVVGEGLVGDVAAGFHANTRRPV